MPLGNPCREQHLAVMGIKAKANPRKTADHVVWMIRLWLPLMQYAPRHVKPGKVAGINRHHAAGFGPKSATCPISRLAKVRGHRFDFTINLGLSAHAARKGHQ
jgi:hypothetical protein